MFLRIAAAVLLVASTASVAHGQTRLGGKAPAAPPPIPSPIPGYEARQIEGFTLAFSPESIRHLDDAEFERKPLEVLQLELSTIAKLLRPEAVAILRAKVLTIV